MSNPIVADGGGNLSHPLPGQHGSGRRSIAARAAFVSWTVIFVALGLFVVFIIPRQEAIHRERLESTAAVVTPVPQVMSTSLR